MKRGVTTWLDAFSQVMAVFFDLETDLLIMLDGSGRIARINPAGEQRLGYEPGGLHQVYLIELVSMGDLTVFIEDCRRTDIGETGREFNLLRRGGGLCRVRLVKFHFERLIQQSYLILRPA